MDATTYSLFRIDLAARLAPTVAIALAAAGAAVAAGLYVKRMVTPTRRIDGECGTTELEFALALPVFLVSVLTVVQMALMVNATLVVDYAAFCAARSAAVWLPQDTPGEAAHTIAATPSNASAKWTRIRGAAVLAVTPISPRITSFRFGIVSPPERTPVDGTTLAKLARAADVAANRPVDWARVALDAANKSVYADWFTQVDLVDSRGRSQRQFADGGTVTAMVTHDFEMAVPLAGPGIGAVFGKRYIPVIGGYYVPISSSYTLQVAHS